MHDPAEMTGSFSRSRRSCGREHRLRPNQSNDFRIQDRTQFLAAQAEAGATLTFLLAGIAAVSLWSAGSVS